MLPGRRESNQSISNGDNNNQAGRDMVVNNYYVPSTISFYPEDIKHVITYFASNTPEIGKNKLSLKKIDIEKKNEINNLSDRYFKYMKDKHLLYFTQIQVFLGDPKNKEYLEMYNNTVEELQFRIASIRSKYNYFEEIFTELVDFIITTKEIELVKNRNLFIIFLNFMYWNCDVGDKE